MTRFISRPATRRGILLLALAAVASFLATRDVKQEFERPVSDVDTQLNYALFDFRAMLLDERGRLSVIIEAPELRNNASSGVGTVTRPKIFARETGNEWHIKAESAVVSPDREFVDLTGEVNVVRYNALQADTVEIDTSDLLVAVTPRTASTDAPVRMRQDGDRLTATGMRIDMINDRFELLNAVTAVYETP